MNFSAAGMFAGVIFGSIGVGYFMYGRRQTRPVHLACGITLAVFPWFVTNLVALIGIGIALIAAPFLAAWWFGL